MAARSRRLAAEVVGHEEPWSRTARLEDAMKSWLTYMKNSGRSDGYAGPKGQLNMFLGIRTGDNTTWQPLTSFLLARKLEKVGQMSEKSIGDWLQHLRDQKLSQYTYSKAVELLKRYLRWLVDEGELSEMPIKLRTPPSPEAEIAVFTDKEIDALHKVVRSENVRDYAIFMVLVDTGVRANELCSLTLDNVRLERGEIVVDADIAKNKKGRTLTLTTSLSPLKKYLQARPKVKNDAVFLSFYSTPVYAGSSARKPRAQTGNLPFSDSGITTGGLRQLVRKWGVLGNITDARCSPHTFRHYYAISYLRGGGDVFSLQRLLGHKKLEMTMRYAKLVDVDVRDRQRQFSPALRFSQNRFKRAEVAI
jgi:integrase/recombinase XerD